MQNQRIRARRRFQLKSPRSSSAHGGGNVRHRQFHPGIRPSRRLQRRCNGLCLPFQDHCERKKRRQAAGNGQEVGHGPGSRQGFPRQGGGGRKATQNRSRHAEGARRQAEIQGPKRQEAAAQNAAQTGRHADFSGALLRLLRDMRARGHRSCVPGRCAAHHPSRCAACRRRRLAALDHRLQAIAPGEKISPGIPQCA